VISSSYIVVNIANTFDLKDCPDYIKKNEPCSSFFTEGFRLLFLFGCSAGWDFWQLYGLGLLGQENNDRDYPLR
jgi:hypothetical protein